MNNYKIKSSVTKRFDQIYDNLTDFLNYWIKHTDPIFQLDILDTLYKFKFLDNGEKVIAFDYTSFYNLDHIY